MGVFDQMFVVSPNLNMLRSCALRLMVAEAKQLILELRSAMLHSLIWDTISGRLFPPYIYIIYYIFCSKDYPATVDFEFRIPGFCKGTIMHIPSLIAET